MQKSVKENGGYYNPYGLKPYASLNREEVQYILNVGKELGELRSKLEMCAIERCEQCKDYIPCNDCKRVNCKWRKYRISDKQC